MEKISKKTRYIISSSALFGVLLFSFIFHSFVSPPNLASQKQTEQTQQQIGQSASGILAKSQQTETQQTGTPQTGTKEGETVPVVRVVDGDTIIVRLSGDAPKNSPENAAPVDERVRLIGVNTPESVDPRKPVQCFGKQASEFLSSILTGKSVRIVADPSQSDRDVYGRLLRYIYLNDILINEEIIQEGYGFEYTYYKNGNPPYEFQNEFKASEKYAKAGGLGLWATSTCSGRLINAI